jgi:tetratricopeptide (TPR) repeat protein
MRALVRDVCRRGIGQRSNSTNSNARRAGSGCRRTRDTLAGRTDASRYQLVEQIGRPPSWWCSYNRQLALFYDHDLKPNEAYGIAAREYAIRRDIYGADTLAWSALKAGKTAEAQTAIKEALRLGTRDARLFYHAGLIAQAAGDRAAANEYLQRALSLNPKFDPLQAEIARKELAVAQAQK